MSTRVIRSVCLFFAIWVISGCQSVTSNLQTYPVTLENEQPTESIAEQANNFAKNLQSATKGDAEGQYMVGWRYLKGKGVTKDIEQAKYWFELSCKVMPSHKTG